MRRKKNKEFNNITIERVGSKGKSIGTADDGKTIIIDGGAPGDIVNILTTKQRKSYYQGKITEFHKYSDIRTNPKCEHFGICGGCKWQHIKYEEQLKFKEDEVKNNLVRIGNLTLPKITPIKGAINSYFYRNKMEYSFSDSRWLSLEEIKSKKIIKEKNALGFHIPGMWNKVVDINKCWLQEEITNTLRNSIKDFSIKNNIPFFNHSNQTGDLRTLMIRTTSTNEVMVLIQFVPILLGLSIGIPIFFFGEWEYGLITGALLWTLGGTAFLIGLGWILRLVGVEYDLQKKEAAYRKILVVAEDDNNIRPKTINELFDDVRSIHFLSYLRYLYFNIGRMAYLQANVLSAYVFLAPAIVAGVVTLGVMQQIIRAFGRVEGSMQYLLKAWPTIIELASVYKRLREFENVINSSRAMDEKI